MVKLTYKKHPAQTGLAGIGHPYQSSDIKISKKKMGLIIAPNWNKTGWQLGFAIKKERPDDNPNCDWRWFYFSNRFETEIEAKQCAEKSINRFMEIHNLHYFDD